MIKSEGVCPHCLLSADYVEAKHIETGEIAIYICAVCSGFSKIVGNNHIKLERWEVKKIYEKHPDLKGPVDMIIRYLELFNKQDLTVKHEQNN